MLLDRTDEEDGITLPSSTTRERPTLYILVHNGYMAIQGYMATMA